jgi:hypothetical protein
LSPMKRWMSLRAKRSNPMNRSLATAFYITETFF